MPAGVVSLVGAGPGDPFLLTLAGREALSEADCVVFDRLVHPRVLSFARPDAEQIFVGKEAGNRYTPQEEICRLLIELARSGKRVVRLKGGDPLMFARGAEEIDALAAAGIAYEVIPGVTAALGAAASAAIPLTHRQYSSMVTFVTGHDDPNKARSIDWAWLARQPGTLVVYMARAKLASIAQELLANGMPGSTPIAFVQWGGSNRQRVHVARLGEARSGPPEAIGTPMLAIIGAVVGERALTRWFENRPLFGQGVLVLRPRGQSEGVARRLERLGADVYCQPAIRVVPVEDWSGVDRVMENFRAGDWLVFTSANGVHQFFCRLFETGRDLRVMAGVQIAAIGPATSAALRALHLHADLVPETYRSEDLAEALVSRAGKGRVILARADRGRDVLERTLRECGAEVESVVVYRQEDVADCPPWLEEVIDEGRVTWVLLSSSNVARRFLGWMESRGANIDKDRIRLASISPVTSAAVGEMGYEVSAEAREYTMDGMVEAIMHAIRQ